MTQPVHESAPVGRDIRWLTTNQARDSPSAWVIGAAADHQDLAASETGRRNMQH